MSDKRNSQHKKKESVLDLSKYTDKEIQVSFAGGRQVQGLLRGYDPLMNIVLDQAVEMSEPQRTLGLVVCRGPSVIVVNPVEGTEAISNPFAQ